MHTRRLLALAVSVALVLSLALTGCCKDTTDHSDDILAALSSLFETTYGDDITVTNSQWLHTVLASALNGNKGQPQVEGALSTALSCNRTFDDLKTQAPADKDHAYDLVLQAAGTDAHAAAQNAFSQWTDTLNAVLTAEGQYTADLAVIQASGSYYILLHFKVGDVKDPVDPEPDEPEKPDTRLHIYNEDQFVQWVHDVNYGNANTNCVLEADLDFSDYPALEPIAENSTFYGSFDGQGHSISHLTLKSNGYFVGLFASLSSRTTVSNLELNDITVAAPGAEAAGALVGYNAGFVSNCTVKNSTVQAKMAGGMVGRNETAGNYSDGGFLNGTCVVTNTTILATGDDAYAGGIVAWNAKGGVLYGCKVDGSTTIQAKGTNSACAGGIVGSNPKEGNIDTRQWSVLIDDNSITATAGGVTVNPGTADQAGPAYAGRMVGYNANSGDAATGPVNQ